MTQTPLTNINNTYKLTNLSLSQSDFDSSKKSALS